MFVKGLGEKPRKNTVYGKYKLHNSGIFYKQQNNLWWMRVSGLGVKGASTKCLVFSCKERCRCTTLWKNLHWIRKKSKNAKRMLKSARITIRNHPRSTAFIIMFIIYNVIILCFCTHKYSAMVRKITTILHAWTNFR